ncbi:MAG: hypothetical protein A2Z88_00580 [Omnitrophica WOR_2 bacterium GWA2_47_8]|nr:MAG: hypothetical protein A2Z88_00580 [Omnitrophica WOR_2 bacterium GWA2_47_8]
MNKSALINNSDTLKVTALLYFKEALAQERYEECAELIQAAKNFGVEQDEVKGIINEHVAKFGLGRRNGANQKKAGRF